MTENPPNETTDPLTLERSEYHDSARIYPLLSDPGNEQLLVEWLDSIGGYEVVSQSTSIENASFDICVIDQQALTENFEALKQRKEAEQPVLLPYLLLLPDKKPEFLQEERGQLPDSLVQDTIDEMLSLPVRQFELRWRLESLLRMRGQTRTLANREQKLRQFKRAVTAAGHAIYITDRNGTITYVNPAFEQITGYSEVDAIGETPRLLNSGEHPEEYFEDLWETVLAGGVWEEQIIDERKNGEQYHANQTIAPFRDSGGDIEGFVAVQTDITERKRIEEKRRQYQQAIEGSVELLSAIDRDGNYLFGNEPYREYHGIEDGNIRERGIRDVLDSEIIAEIEPHLEAVLDGETRQFETRRTHPEMGERVLEVLYYPLVDDDGDIQGIAGSFRDITEKKERSRRMQTLINNLPGIVYRCHNEAGWPMEYVGGQCEAVTGYQASTLESGEVSWGHDIVHPEDRENVVEEVQTAVEEGETFKTTYRIQTASGETRWVEEQGKEVDSFIHDEPLLEGFMTDITERKEREMELYQMTRAIHEAPIGIVITDPQQDDNPLIYVNDAFVDLTGYSRSDALGKNCRFLQGKDTDPETVAHLRESIDADDPVSVTIRNYRKNGSEFWNHLEVAPVRDSSGEVINYIGFQQDVTELVERQQQLQVIDRVLRHNLNNDMNVIKGLAEQIQTEDDETLAEYAGRIIETSDSLLDTMDKEREITGLLEDEPLHTPIELTSSLQPIVETVREEYPTATIELTVPEETVVRATSKIEKAIEELLRNALEHNDRDTPRVSVLVSVTEGEVGIKIADNGPDIPEMERDILLGNGKMTPLYHGSGLGLWLVQLIVRRSNGRIDFVGNEPRGNIVTVRLPEADPT